MNNLKKMLSVLFLVSIGFSSFAKSGVKEYKVPSIKKIITYTSKTKTPTTQWQVTVHCGSINIVSCCYSSYSAAMQAGYDIYDNLQCSNMPS